MVQQVLNAFYKRLREKGVKRKELVKITHLGDTRVYEAYDTGDDTIILERDILRAGNKRLPITVTQKRDFRISRKGMVMTVTTGNYSTVIKPLLEGALWNLSNVNARVYSTLIQSRIVLASLTEHGIEISQNETSFDNVVAADQWMRSKGLSLAEVYFISCSESLHNHYRLLGQAWRIHGIVYTLAEKTLALNRSLHAVDSQCRYFCSSSGAFYLSYTEFLRVTDLARTDIDAFRAVLREWLALQGDYKASNMRRTLPSGTRVIEIFGLPLDECDQLVIPALERLLEGLTIGRSTAEDAWGTMLGIGLLVKQMLINPAYANSKSVRFVQDLYPVIAGFSVAATLAETPTTTELLSLNFDARRLPIPGATYTHGVPEYHPGIDARTRAILDHIERSLDFNEIIEYVNVYDVRSTKSLSSDGLSREIVYKTNRQPLPISIIEKRLASARKEYGSYMLARANAFRALGGSYPRFQLLAHPQNTKTKTTAQYFLRSRCPGEPLDLINPTYLLTSVTAGDVPVTERSEDPEILLKLAYLYGTAAAQNIIAKKYVATEQRSRYGIGKEIFEFAYDPMSAHQVPVAVRVCSIRGIMGWPVLDRTEENLHEIYRFYIKTFATKLCDFWLAHRKACSLNEMANAYFTGCETMTRTMAWRYHSNRKAFDEFSPGLRDIYHFTRKWSFALWALDRHEADLPSLRDRFMDAVRDTMIHLRNQGAF